MKIFLTGGAGFIGSWVAELLLREGHQVTVFDNLSTGHREEVPAGAKLVVGDLRNRSEIDRALSGHDWVFNFAAKIIVPESVRDPEGTFETNLRGGWNLLEAMRKAEIQRIVHSSTAAVYGIPAKVPIEEDDPKWPINPYGASKLAFEALLHSYHAAHGFDVILFRYFNPYGPGQEYDKTKAVTNFIDSTLSARPIPLYWQGEQARDFFYIEDIARAHLLGLGQTGFHYYNLGSGTSTKVIDVLHLIFELVGGTASIQDLGERAGDPPILHASIDKVKRELGWQPSTDLRTGLEKTIEHFRSLVS